MVMNFGVCRYKVALFMMSVLLVSMGFASVARGQSAAASGQIVGQVLDPSSAAVGGGQITVRNTNTNFTRTTTTDSEGRYAIPELPLGPYDVTAKATGFADITQQLYVSLGASVPSNFRLSVAPTS